MNMDKGHNEDDDDNSAAAAVATAAKVDNSKEDDDDNNSAAAAAVAVVAEADRTATAAAALVDLTPIITIQELPPLAKIVTALQDDGVQVPNTSQAGIQTMKYDYLEKLLTEIAKKIIVKNLFYITKNQTRVKQGLLEVTLAARKKHPKSQVAGPIEAVLPKTHIQSDMYIIDPDDVDTAGLLGVVLNFINLKQAFNNGYIHPKSRARVGVSKVEAVSNPNRVATATASAAARRKKTDKIKATAAAATAVKSRKRPFFHITKSLTLDVADEICTHAIAVATRNLFNPICICVMDPAGHVIVTKRMDGCPPMVYPKISHAKANTCVSTKSSSRAYAAKYLQRPHNSNDDDDHDGEVGPSTFTRVINQITTAGGDLAAFQGGILVKEKSTGVIVGSVGVSGAAGDEDEYCAIEGVHRCSMSRELVTVPEQPMMRLL